MITRLSAISLAAVALAAFSLPALGFPGGRHGDRGDRDRGAHMQKHLDELELTDETRAEIEAILADADAQREALHAELESAHESLRALLEADEPDTGAVLDQAEVLGELKTKLHKLRLGSMLDVRALLTPEQREQLREERRERSGWSRDKAEGFGARGYRGERF